MIAEAGRALTRLPRRSTGDRWIAAARLLNWTGLTGAKRGPTTAANGRGPCAVRRGGAEVRYFPRHPEELNHEPSREAHGPWVKL